MDSDHVMEVLTEAVTTEYLDHLQSCKVSHLFAGKRRLDLAVALDKLRRHFLIRRVRINTRRRPAAGSA